MMIYNASILNGLKPVLIMVMVQIAMAGLNVFYKLAANDGMSLQVMVAYRFLFAAAFMVPLAIFVERGKRPKLTGIVVIQAFFCALFGGSLAQNLYTETIVLTSATFASAITNLIPILTFILALFFGMEILDLKTLQGKAKVIGILVSFGGAMFLTLYKGLEIVIWSTHIDPVQENQHKKLNTQVGSPSLGAFLGILGCFFVAISTIIQAKMSERYPCPYSSTALIALMGSIQACVFARITQSDWSRWKLGWNIRLLSVAYAGIVASGLAVIFIMWCIQLRGPLFVSIFSPLMLVFTALAGSLALDEKLHLGSVLGCVLIICGLYLVLWGKGKDMPRIASVTSEGKRVSNKVKVVVSSVENEKSNGNEGRGIAQKTPVSSSNEASKGESPFAYVNK